MYLLAELVHSFFLTTPLLYVFTFSLGGSTEPPEPPLDPPQKLSDMLRPDILILGANSFLSDLNNSQWSGVAFKDI